MSFLDAALEYSEFGWTTIPIGEKKRPPRGFTCQACRELGADVVIASDVWEWSSLMRSLGYSARDDHWSSRAYPSHYRLALSHTDILIQPYISLSGYVPNSAALDRMIAVGESATYRAIESLSKRLAA
jgi:hypothetical protein